MDELRPVSRTPLIPDELALTLYRGRFDGGGRSTTVYCYTTEGMTRHRQQELVFAVLPTRPDDPPPTFPAGHAVAVYRSAAAGQPYGPGDVLQFAQWGADADPRLSGVACTPPPAAFPALAGMAGNALLAVPLVADETAVAVRYGSARVLSLLGDRARYHPFPWWFEPGRPPVLDRAAYAAGTALAGLTACRLPDLHVVQAGTRLVVSVGVGQLALLTRVLSEAPEVCAYQPGPAAVDRTLVWEPGQPGPRAINSPTATGGCFGGNFLLIGQVPDRSSARQLEDGFAVWLTGRTYAQLVAAVAAGRPAELPLDGDELRTLLFVPRARGAPIGDGVVFDADSESVSYRTDPIRPASAAQPPLVRVGPIELVLHGGHRAADGIDAADLGAFVSTALRVVDGFLQRAPTAATALTVAFHLVPGQPVRAEPREWTGGPPPPGTADLAALLGTVLAPPTDPPGLSFDLVVQLRP
ncbi:hypothetical protein GCM10009557_46120 [Virgisporangium ochraceum]